MEQPDNCKPSVAKTMRHELVHLIASIVLAGVLGSYFRNYLVGLWTFALCMFLDGDHLFDYFSYLLKFKKEFSLKEFLSGSYFAEWKKFVVPLHSWEMVLGFALLFLVFKNPFLIATSLALGVHYFVDYFTNDVNKKAYFMLYRAKHNFKKAAIRTDFVD